MTGGEAPSSPDCFAAARRRQTTEGGYVVSGVRIESRGHVRKGGFNQAVGLRRFGLIERIQDLQDLTTIDDNIFNISCRQRVSIFNLHNCGHIFTPELLILKPILILT